MNEIYYIHGSKSSLDLDVFVVVSPLEHLSIDERHKVCHNFEDVLMGLYPGKDVNVNLISIEQGKVVWCFKGTVDEVNNSLLDTYHLHTQPYQLLVKERVLRDFELKALRAVRVILSFLSRTPHREMVKSALKGDILHKLSVLENIDLSQVTDLGTKNTDFKDYLKTVAFQLGQVFGLFDNKELYTKESIAESYPYLKSFVMREDEVDLTVLEYYKGFLVEVLKKRDWKRLYE